MTPAELSYSRGVAVADKLLSVGIPIIGVSGSVDGDLFGLNVLVGADLRAFSFPVDTNIMTAEAHIRAALAEQREAACG